MDLLFDTILEYLILRCPLGKHPIEHEAVLLWPIRSYSRAYANRLQILREAGNILSSFTVFDRVLGTKPSSRGAAISAIHADKSDGHRGDSPTDYFDVVGHLEYRSRNLYGMKHQIQTESAVYTQKKSICAR